MSARPDPMRNAASPNNRWRDRTRVVTQLERDRVEPQGPQRQQFESLGQLAGGVAHDLNNLLAAILNHQ